MTRDDVLAHVLYEAELRCELGGYDQPFFGITIVVTTEAWEVWAKDIASRNGYVFSSWIQPECFSYLSHMYCVYMYKERTESTEQ